MRALAPLLPSIVVWGMVGGDLGIRQVPPARRQALIERRLRERGGTNGERLARMRSLLSKVRKYAIGE